MKNANNDNDPNPWSTIGLQTALIVNRLRCQSQLRELVTEETSPAEQSELSEGRTKQNGAAIVGLRSRLTIQYKGAKDLKSQHPADDHLRESHPSKPHESENGKPDDKRDDDRAKEDQRETERADIERRVRDILAMENRLIRKRI